VSREKRAHPSPALWRSLGDPRVVTGDNPVVLRNVFSEHNGALSTQVSSRVTRPKDSARIDHLGPLGRPGGPYFSHHLMTVSVVATAIRHCGYLVLWITHVYTKGYTNRPLYPRGPHLQRGTKGSKGGRDTCLSPFVSLCRFPSPFDAHPQFPLTACTRNGRLLYSGGMGTNQSRITAVAYCRVSTTEQEVSGHSLDDQETTLRDLAASRGWDVIVVRETGSGKSLSSRPLLTTALQALDGGTVQVLMAVRLDRLSRSVADFSGLMDRADRRGWDLHVADLGLDTSTPSGRLVAQVLAATAEHERRLIGERTREGLRAARAKGVRLGRPHTLPSEVRHDVRTARESGLSLRAIAEDLNARGVPTAHGGSRWHASTVRAVLNS